MSPTPLEPGTKCGAVTLHQSHLLIIEDDMGSKEFFLKDAVYSIGRDRLADIRLFSQFVSRRHATLVRRYREDGSSYYRIVDGNFKGKPSVNGLSINGHKLQSHDLQNEDKIVFGPQVSATYYLLHREIDVQMQPNERDTTLPMPGVIGNSKD